MKKHRKISPTEKTLPDIQAKILISIEAGFKRVAYCKAAGICYDTFRKWMESEEPKFVEFQNAIKKAEENHEHDMIGKSISCIETAIEKGIWQAAARYLESRDAANWSRRTEVSGTIKTVPASHSLGSTK